MSLEPQASSGLRWNNSSGRCACPTAFCRPCFLCDAALLSHARPNVVFIFACDASSCTQLKFCAKLRSQHALRWLTFHFDPRVLCWCRARSAKSYSSIRLWLHLRPGAEQCVFLPRLEESSPGAYLPASVPVPVAAPCHPAPRLEVSSPGARSSADLVAYCHWLPTLCCRLEVSSPVTQRPASFSGIAPDAVVHRSWYLPPGCELNPFCSSSWSPADSCAQTTTLRALRTCYLGSPLLSGFVYKSFSLHPVSCASLRALALILLL